MKRILILAAISCFTCSVASAFQGGGGESTKKGSSQKKVVTKKKSTKKSTPATKNASNRKPSTANLSEPKILWANDCDPRTSANYCQISDSLAILNEFYDAVKSVNGTITYHVPNSKQELEPYTVVILDFCFGAANDNSINVIKQYIQEGGSAFIMGGNFCVPGPNKRSTAWYASRLTKDFGVTFTADDDSSIKWADSVDAHPVTFNVNRIYIGRHAYLNVSSPSQSIIKINGQPIAAIYDGTGTFVALSNENFEWGANHRNEVASSSNFVLWRNSLKWLISQSKTKRLGLVTSQPRPPDSPAPTVQIFGPGSSIDLGNNIKLELVQINAGSFRMGSTKSDDEMPVHAVTISQPFYLGKYEVTQEQWQVVMNNNPSEFKDCHSNCPVERVSWDDAQAFIKKLNERNSIYTFRLPTEAEWEYAARAGTTGDYAGNVDEMAWYSYNAGNRTHPVGSKQPNAWGLYDMHGNVEEWCQDWRDRYSPRTIPEADPQGPSSGQYRVSRGGSWGDDVTDARSAGRSGYTPGNRGSGNGFRVVAVARAP